MAIALFLLSTLSLTTAQFVPSPGTFPATGDDANAGGILCIPLSALPTFTAQFPPSNTGTESPKTAGSITSGSGPYPAQMITDSSLTSHTIYAPKTLPSGNLSMPFIAWANGACQTDGSYYRNFLTEIASWGYVIAADGAPSAAGAGGQSKVQDSRDSIVWATSGKAAKYGNIDTTKIVTAGHSCGGL
jgi:hypothetical protein